MARSKKEWTKQARRDLLDLLKSLAYRRGVFKLASGVESDFFIDCKQAVLTAQGHHLVGQLMLDGLRHLPKCDAVAGVALGGCPLASAVSLMSQIRARPVPALYVRKAAKDHGTAQLIEGPLTPGMRVVMVEDVVTTGGSTLQAVDTLKGAGVQVVGAVVLVDRLEGGIEHLRRAGLEVVALYTRRDFVDDEPPLSATLSDSTFE